MSRNHRILVAKIGLDGHDRGAKIVARYLKESGYEVIYSGSLRSPIEIARIAAQEDVYAIGISILSGSHIPLLSQLIELVQVSSSNSPLIFLGGVIPESDLARLKEMGIHYVFPREGNLEMIIEWLDSQ